ncbi:MAG: class 1 fructose-bisphosphatase [Nitrososphaerales archaeon]
MVQQPGRDYIFLEEGLNGANDSRIERVFIAIAKTGQLISKQLSFRVGMTQKLNPFGERQAELDVFANDAFSKSLFDTGVVGSVASEEMEHPLLKEGANADSLSVAMDPLDGSSNITTNNPLGSIFGIWRGSLPQPGRNLLASAFITYGPTLSITLTNGKSVDQYIEARDGKDFGRFVLAYKSMSLPEKPEVYGFGGTRSDWIPEVEKFVGSMEERGMHLRYGGTFIGDYNQVIQRGGIFSYPAHKNKPKGKLRVLYETAPVSYLTELAGGSSSDGKRSILEIEPKKLSETSPFYVGNTSLVRELQAEIESNAQ